MIKGTTRIGFNYEVSEAHADNYELLELIGNLGSDASATPKLVNMLLGPEQATALKEHLRGDNGIIKASAMFEAVDDIISALPKAKN